MGWKLVGVALLVLVSCEPVRDETAVDPEPPATPVTALRRVRVPVVGDFSVAPAVPDTELTTVGAPALTAGRGSVVLFAVERPHVPARCIADVRLRLFAERWAGLAGEELTVYPSQVVNALRKRDGDRFGYSWTLLDVRPRATFEGVAGGWGEWDVTGIVKRWVGSGVFPSQGRRVPERGPVVLALRDVDLAEPLVTVTIASLESEHPPEVVAFVDEDCPSTGRA